jgi:hypothetical protein
MSAARIKQIDKIKSGLLKKVDFLIAKKKKLYSNMDITSAKSAEEKQLDTEIANLFSQLNTLILEKRKLVNFTNNMKSEKDKLAAKTVDQLKAAAKRLGGKLVTPDGKAKTKQQLINTIVMKQRLSGKSMGGNVKPTAVKAKTGKVKLDALKTKAKKLGYQARMANKPFRASGNPELLSLFKNLSIVEATAIFKAYNSGYVDAALEQGRIALTNYLKKKA